MYKNKYGLLVAAGLVTISLLVGASAFAQSAQGLGRGMGGGQKRGSVVMGTVTANNGNTITISGKQGFAVKPNAASTATTTYTVDVTKAKVTKNNTTITTAGITVGDTVVVQGTISGNSVTATNIRDGIAQGGMGRGRGIAGTVASVSGTTITVTSKVGPKGGVATTYIVDASGATVTKNGIASSVSSIGVGDEVMVQGTISGTSVVAKDIRDGAPGSVIQGDGQPIVAGSVTAISGNTITITNKSNVTYTIDVTNAKFVVNGVTNPTVSNVAVGDNLTIQGTVNGNSVVASSVIDQKVKANNGTANTEDNQNSKPGFIGGMVNGIGSFFKHLFGF
jgi:hypothetical protein